MASAGATAGGTPQGLGPEASATSFPSATPVAGPGEAEEDDAEEPAEVYGAARSLEQELQRIGRAGS